VLDSLAQLEREGFAVTLLEPDETGRVPPEAVQTALRADTLLVSLMLANNEIGVVNDIAACARFATAAGALIHCDAAQAVGKLPVAVRELGVDFLSFTAHKFYGPKGVGALYVKEAARPRLAPLLLGGGHERGLRSGTLPTHQIVGFAAAAALAHERRATDAAHTRDLATRLERELETIPGIAFNHRPVDGIPGLVNVSFEGVEGESLVTGLPEIAVSTGSACSSATREPSYVLRALGRDPELAQSSLRISLGRYTTVEEVDAAATAIRAEVARLRSLAGEAGMVPGPRIDADSPLATGNSLLGRALNPLARRHFLARARPAEFPDGACPPGVRQGRAGRRADGAQVLIELHISGGTVKIARFNAYGCPHTLAVTSWLCETLQGVGIAAASVGTPADWARKFSVPTEKLGRLLIVEDALRAALEQAREVAPQGLSQGL
jgi:cysteine desulfurase